MLAPSPCSRLRIGTAPQASRPAHGPPDGHTCRAESLLIAYGRSVGIDGAGSAVRVAEVAQHTRRVPADSVRRWTAVRARVAGSAATVSAAQCSNDHSRI